MPKQLFVILTQPRSGSYLLVDLLNQFPGVLCHGEMFKPHRLKVAKDVSQQINWTIEDRDGRPIYCMREILAIGDDTATGFKLFPDHNRRLWRNVMSSEDIHKIVLLRHPISRYLSRLRAETTGSWVQPIKKSKAGRKRKAAAAPIKRGGLQTLIRRLSRLRDKIKAGWAQEENQRPSSKHGTSFVFEAERFERFIIQHNKFAAETSRAAAANPATYTSVDYEEVVSLQALERICPVLGFVPVDTSGISPSLQKQTTEPLSQLVSNFGEMKQYLIERHPALLEQHGCPSLDCNRRPR